MKKTLLIILLGGMLSSQAAAQTGDTLPWMYDKYHYSLWYDTLPEFFQSDFYNMEPSPMLKIYSMSGFGEINYSGLLYHHGAMPQYVERPTLLTGVAITEGEAFIRGAAHPWYLPEWVYLLQKVGDSLVLLDSMRWDTISYKLLKIALHADTQQFGFEYVRVREVLFKAPILVDSVFYFTTTDYGQVSRPQGEDAVYFNTDYLTVSLSVIGNRSRMITEPWYTPPRWWQIRLWDSAAHSWNRVVPNVKSPFFGGYFPMVDYVDLIVTSSDTSRGTAGPTARVSRNLPVAISATPKRGYRFSHWQEDGDRQPARSVTVSADTTYYTAVFVSTDTLWVEGRSDNAAMGRVDGSGAYFEGDTARLTAVPSSPRYRFSHWSSGSTANPLEFEVTASTVLTAYFVEANPSGIVAAEASGTAFVLTPNPARGMVAVALATGAPQATVLKVLDMAGHEVLSQPVASGAENVTLDLSALPAGTYFVTLATPQGSSTQKLILE